MAERENDVLYLSQISWDDLTMEACSGVSRLTEAPTPGAVVWRGPMAAPRLRASSSDR